MSLSFQHRLPGFRQCLHSPLLRHHWVPPFLQPPHHPCSLHRHPGQPSPHRSFSPAIQHVSLRYHIGPPVRSRTVSPSTSLQLCAPLLPPWPVCPETLLGSLFSPGPAVPTPPTSPSSSLIPLSSRSAESTLLPQSCEPAPQPQASRPLMSPWSISHSGVAPSGRGSLCHG